MTKILVLLILLQICSEVNAQWQWSQHWGGYSFNYPDDKPQNLLINNNNLTLLGTYGNSLIIPGDTLPGNGLSQIFMVTLDESGVQNWFTSIGGNYNSASGHDFGICTSDKLHDNIYISGSVIGMAQFDSILIGGSSLNLNDLFLGKIDQSGHPVWAKRWHNANYDDGTDISINHNNLPNMIGQNVDTINVDGAILPPGGSLYRFDEDGNLLFARALFSRSISGWNMVYLHNMNEDLIMHGYFDTPTFQLDTSQLINNGNSDAFLARADSNGNVKWINRFGFGGTDRIQSLDIDSSFNFYITGIFSDSIQFDNTMLYNSTQDVFVAKMDSSGNAIWVTQLSSTGSVNYGNQIVVDPTGGCYVTGEFSGTTHFGNFTVTASSSTDMFLARYDSNGACLGVKNFGQASGNCVVLDSSGNVCVAGTFTGTVNIGNNTFTSYGGKDVFIAKSNAITGFEEIRTSSDQLLIYANPNAGTCQITIPEPLLNEKELTLRVHNSSGQVIQQKSVHIGSEKIRINLTAEAKGIYNVTLSNGNKIYYGKIVFE
jgi:Secretion system C-terminal sorting domain